jgi:hypothetical protein
MDKSFTTKQREIVARKMGYDGPMQGFDNFLASSPSDAQKYSAITSKFVERMAKGGFVKGYAAGGVVTKISDAEIKDFYEQNKNNPELVKSTAVQYGVSPQDITRATGVPFQ